MADLAKLRALHEAATPGPWQAMNEYQWDSIIGDIDGPDDGDMHYELATDITSHHARSRANAALIVAAVNALPDLIAEIERLRAIAEAVERDAIDRKVESGVMVMKDGKAWGITYEDGHSTRYGWMSPADAPIHDARFCRKPTDVTYPGSYLIPELEKGEIVSVERTTTIRLLAIGEDGNG